MVKNEKKVIVNFKNPEADMKLKVKGKNSVDNALKIMKAFDEACSEIRDMERENKE